MCFYPFADKVIHRHTDIQEKSPDEPRGKPIFYFLLKHLLNIGAGNGAREARIYFPISSFKAADTFQISRLFEECDLAFDCTI